MPAPEPLQNLLDLDSQEPVKLHDVQYWLEDVLEESNGSAHARYDVDQDTP